MAGRCVACDGEIGDDAERCPSCGLAFTTDAPATSLAGPADPAHVGLYFGSVPSAIPESSAEPETVERETPAAPLRERGLEPRRAVRWAFVAALAIFAVLAGLALVEGARRPDDELTQREIAFERFEDAEALDPPDLAEPIDVDAVIAKLGDAETRRAALAAHRPFDVEARASIHAFFDAYLARVLEISPDSAFRLGVHPHPTAPGAFDDATRIRWILLCRDAAGTLRDWPGAERLPVHDRIDRLALIDEVEMSLRWEEREDLDRLDHLDRWFDPFVQLAEVDSCPAADRISVATARLRAMPAHILGLTEHLVAPPRSRVFATANGLDAANHYLGDYAKVWAAAPDAAVAELETALGPARQALMDCARLLRNAIDTRATGSAATGPSNTATILRFHHHLPLDARTLYRQALEALREAHDAMRACRGRGRREIPQDLRAASRVQVLQLRGACNTWIGPQPADEGVRIGSLPWLWEWQGAAAVYLDRGALADLGAGVVLVAESPLGDGANDRELRDLRRRHTLAHEAYPGHRLQAVACRSVCALRRFIDDRVLVEGWAVYAEDLLHEFDGCAGGVLDDWERAVSRSDRSDAVLLALLFSTGAISDAGALELYRALGAPGATLADIGAAAAQGLYQLGYLIGRDEILALRRAEEDRLGDAFDLRAFHAKLLAAGPISPRLIAEEWRAEDR